MELFSLTINADKATHITLEHCESVMDQAVKDFPDYKLCFDYRDGYAIIRTDGMKVQRWLRL